MSVGTISIQPCQGRARAGRRDGAPGSRPMRDGPNWSCPGEWDSAEGPDPWVVAARLFTAVGTSGNTGWVTCCGMSICSSSRDSSCGPTSSLCRPMAATGSRTASSKSRPVWSWKSSLRPRNPSISKKPRRHAAFSVPEFWVADPAGRVVQRLAFAAREREREGQRVTGTLRWQSDRAVAPLEIDLNGILAPF